MQEVYRVDALVLGAGVVGLAVARALARAGKEVLCLERESSYGMITSSRNSEVIHAGIYYPQGSLKALHCVRGKHWLYDYCQRNNIPHRQCGKLIVASTPEQVSRLEQIQARAENNGVTDLQLLDRPSSLQREPDLKVDAALLSPSTGIIDSHAYMTQLLADLEAAGGQLVCHSEVAFDSIASGAMRLRMVAENALVEAPICVNATGLDAISLLRDVEGFDDGHLPKTYFAKGSYFSYQGRVPFSHLIYPVPVDGGLGVHLTLDMQGAARFGPDVDWVGNDYRDCDMSVAPEKAKDFAAAVRAYWPSLDADRLAPDYSGIRPKLSGPGEPAADFMIQGPEAHGVEGLVNLFGIESPGLTASLSLAHEVCERLALLPAK